MTESVIKPAIISLTFGPKFGAPHHHRHSGVVNDIRYHVDGSLAGRTIVFHPTPSRQQFEIGRAEECWIRLGFNPDSKRYPNVSSHMLDEGNPPLHLFDHWSRKTATFKLIENDWYIYPGGMFLNKETGDRDWGEPKNFVYLNGEKLPQGKNPAPLFRRGYTSANVQLGDGGKIIVTKGNLGSHTTNWPKEIWLGEGWPDMAAIARERVAAAKAEQETIELRIRKEEPTPPATTGHTLADVLVVILTGPDGIDKRLWWVLCGSGALLAYWIHKN